MKKLMLILSLLFASNISAQINVTEKSLDARKSVDCGTCHVCEHPSKADPCLGDCPRFEMVTVHQKPDEGPEIIKMNRVKAEKDLYTPVVFSHRLHAEMSALSGNCSICHHYNPPGDIKDCQTCHKNERQREDVSIPDLKGAYHRQCMDCHYEWDDNVECADCHKLNSEVTEEEVKVEETKYKGKTHPEIETPNKLVYETTNDGAPIVTFFHSDHTDKFGLECSDCHQNESCAKCHADKKEIEADMSFEESHAKCSSCHSIDNCTTCHADSEQKAFDHARDTGFELSGYHSGLDCQACHKEEKEFSGLEGECSNCHSDWNMENFNHEVVGLKLSETHQAFYCENCHIDRDFTAKPECSMCHDDITYPEILPGMKVD
jgi:hypothetical protein